MMKIKAFFSQHPQLLLVIFLIFIWLVFVCLGQLYPTEPISPISPVAKIQQIEETGTPTPTVTDGPTPTPTPTHWSSNSIEVWCDDAAVSDSPVELEVVLAEDEIPLAGLEINIQLHSESGEVELRQASLNLIIPPITPCAGKYLDIPYDWREHEGNLEIPPGIKNEYVSLSYSSFISVTNKPDGTPWAPGEQGWYYIDSNGTPTAKEYGEYEYVRSFDWASPTPTATPTPSVTPTPTPRVIKIYLPIILKSG